VADSDLVKKLLTIAAVDIAVGLAGMKANGILHKVMSEELKDQADPKLANKLFEDYVQTHKLEVKKEVVPALAMKHDLYPENQAHYDGERKKVLTSPSAAKHPAMLLHELGHARSRKESPIRNLITDHAEQAHSIASGASVLAGTPKYAWASAILLILPLYEEWRASGYAKEALEKALPKEEAAKASRFLNKAFGTYLSYYTMQAGFAAALATLSKLYHKKS
jgi:hypothetical protein